MRRRDYSRSDRDRHRSGSKRDRSPGISPSVYPSGELIRHKRSRGSSRDGTRDSWSDRARRDKSKDVKNVNRREIEGNMKNKVGTGADGDILAKLAADLSAKVNKVEAEKLEAVEREMDSLGSKMKYEMSEENEKAEEEIRIRRQERLKKWREQKKKEEESKTSEMSGDIVKGHETIELKKNSITILEKRKSSATESSSVGSGDVKMVATTTPTIIGMRKGGAKLQLGGSRKPKVSALSAAWEADAEDDVVEEEKKKKDYRSITTTSITAVAVDTATAAAAESLKVENPAISAVKEVQKGEEDPLDAFMTTLEKLDEIVEQDSIYDIGMGLEDGIRKSDAARIADVNALGSNTITLDELLGSSGEAGKKAMWESDTGGDDSGIEDEETPEWKQSREEREEKEKTEFIEALRRHDAAGGRAVGAHKDEDDVLTNGKETQVKELGRMWGGEGDVMEEYERKITEKDALQV